MKFLREDVKLVESIAELDENLLELDRVRLNRTEQYSQYVKLIHDGTCFLPYISGRQLAFAPSKYLGYTPNNLETHTDKTLKSGTRTNEALGYILNNFPDTHRGLEEDYLGFCESIGADPGASGSYGKPRRYWMIYRSKSSSFRAVQ